MHDTNAFLQNLALVLCVAAVTTVVFQRLRQPVVFGYLLAGMIVGPYTPIPISADPELVRMTSELGVILLLFSLGLEFSLSRLLKVGPTAGLVAVAQSSAMVWFGYWLGQLFGWTTLESVYAGAIIAISSTTIIAKVFEEQGLKGKFTEIVLGVLIVEDLIGIFLIAILTTISSGESLSAGTLAVTALKLTAFLVGLVAVGLFLVPRTIRAVVRLGRAETTLVVSVGICFAAALVALAFGYSVALGAFIAGSLVAESGEEKTIEHLVRPVRDMFAAIFFVSVGMLIDPALVAQHWGAVLAFTVVVIVGKVGAVTISSFLTGYSPRTSVQAGMSLAQIGEFSFIIAGVGLATGATRSFLYPVAVAVSAITTLTTPWLIRGAGPAAAWVDHALPAPLQTFASLYGSWLERMRASSVSPVSRNRRLVRLLLLDALLIAALSIGVAVEAGELTSKVSEWTGLPSGLARTAVFGSAVLVALPLVFGLMRTARRLGMELALHALPAAQPGKVDFASAPRSALVGTLQLALVVGIGVPLVAVTQPFLGSFPLVLVLLALVAILALGFWRSTKNLQGHAHAGAEVIAMMLGRQMSSAPTPEQLQHDMARVRAALPGLGDPVSVRVEPGSAAADQTLADLDLRATTGATVLAIVRESGQVLVPTGHERVRAGDVLAVGGTEEAIAAAREVLEAPAPAPPPAAPAAEPAMPAEASGTAAAGP
jgi:CPA2 family monovalent cation:H+ antiporter-2